MVSIVGDWQSSGIFGRQHNVNIEIGEGSESNSTVETGVTDFWICNWPPLKVHDVAFARPIFWSDLLGGP